MKKTRLYVTIGVLTGCLVGFVFGLAFESPETGLSSGGNAKGNVSELSKHRHRNMDAGFNEARGEQATSDTLRYTVTDADGESWTMTINK